MLVSRGELNAALNFPTLTEKQQASFDMFHQLVESQCKQFIGYDPTYQQHIEVLPFRYGRATTPRLQLTNLPVRRIVEIIEESSGTGGDGPNDFVTAAAAEADDTLTASGGATLLTAGTDYYLQKNVPKQAINAANGTNADDALSESGILIHMGTGWINEPGSYKVTYVAGFTEQELKGNGSYHRGGALKKAVLDALKSNWEAFKQRLNIGADNPTAGPIIRLGDVTYAQGQFEQLLSSYAVEFPPSVYSQLYQFMNMGKKLGL